MGTPSSGHHAPVPMSKKIPERRTTQQSHHSPSPYDARVLQKTPFIAGV